MGLQPEVVMFDPACRLHNPFQNFRIQSNEFVIPILPGASSAIQSAPFKMKDALAQCCQMVKR